MVWCGNILMSAYNISVNHYAIETNINLNNIYYKLLNIEI